MSRGSQNTQMYKARIFGFNAAVASEKKHPNPEDPDNRGTPACPMAIILPWGSLDAQLGCHLNGSTWTMTRWRGPNEL